MSGVQSDTVAPGGVLGILGGGQLGRMTALAAARLGYRVHVYGPEPDCPASQVAAAATTAPYDDRAALSRFAAAVDVVTYEFENVPAETVAFLAEHRPVRPGAAALATAQDRIREKAFLNHIGVPTAPYAAVRDATELGPGLEKVGGTTVLKTARFGYDGKGQARIEDARDAAAALADLGGGPAIVERFVAFEREISVITARGIDGARASYVPVENRHVDHILDTTIAPAPIAPPVAAGAVAIAEKIADALGLVGLVAVEMFVEPDGGLLVNEIAPRPHNSGHWTIDACAVSQFEQLVRAVCGLPLGSPERHADAVMTNLLGGDADGWRHYLEEHGACLHLYGKTEARPGRKMGHVTRLSPRKD